MICRDDGVGEERKLMPRLAFPGALLGEARLRGTSWLAISTAAAATAAVKAEVAKSAACSTLGRDRMRLRRGRDAMGDRRRCDGGGAGCYGDAMGMR